MPVNVACPHCKQVLSVTEKAYGKTFACPNCKQPMAIPSVPEPQAAAGGHTPPSQGPPGLPPVPSDASPYGLWDTASRAARQRTASGTTGADFANMFMGIEKEFVFQLIPGEEKLDELTIHHRHLFVVQRGLTRVTLTTHRVLYSATLVFSPFYWLLLVLFSPLILYYASRISRNRNVSLPLDKIDSVEKRYRPNWWLFLLALIFGLIIVNLCAAAFVYTFSTSHHHAVQPFDLRGSTSLGEFLAPVVEYIGCSVLGVALLILLLATRVVGVEVRSGNNHLSIPCGPADEACDAFFRRVHVERDRVLKLLARTAHE